LSPSACEIVKVLEGLDKCELCTARKEARQPVYPVGPIKKGTPMVIGRNPGKQEDRDGVPFVGRAGQFLNQYLERIGLKREEVYITNTVKCHTKNDRPPDPIEIKTCSTRWLHKEGAALKPLIIFILGQDSYKGLFGYRISPWIEQTGQIIKYSDGFYVVVLPHPSGALRNKIWMKRYEMVEPELREIVKEVKKRLEE